MSEALQLPIIDLSSTDRISNANSIRQACMEHGFFYLVNHGVEEELVNKVFEQSKKFFSLPVEKKMRLVSKEYSRGYTPLCSENLEDLSSNTKAKASYKESFYAGPKVDGINQWPSEEDLPSWRSTMEIYYKEMLSAGTKLQSLIALALKLDEDFFQKADSLNEPCVYLSLVHYPGDSDSDSSGEEIYGVSPHSDFGTITLLMTDGVPGLQACFLDKTKQPQVWEDVPSLRGAFIVNLGDMMERWTNCLFRSTLHRVVSPKQDRYSVVFFMSADKDCIIECLESCCSESCPPRFPPIRSWDYLEERMRQTFGS
ncbi:Isopenicillin N synthase [Corchorus capsularis]|uniref:Isopenicillin N synthase n=1 Tax=Corchorus capsularis TaxID=210143 RepID=A0A1R3GNC0_COCAP|nr:Isopenicillin N synthase [Corchorus capsularis]